jgi:hypothetical protein
MHIEEAYDIIDTMMQYLIAILPRFTSPISPFAYLRHTSRLLHAPLPLPPSLILIISSLIFDLAHSFIITLLISHFCNFYTYYTASPTTTLSSCHVPFTFSTCIYFEPVLLWRKQGFIYAYCVFFLKIPLTTPASRASFL